MTFVRVSLLWILNLMMFSSCGSTDALFKEGTQPELLSDAFEFTEGPASDAFGNVFFTDQPNNRIHKWSVADGNISVYMEDAGRANGLYEDHNNNLVAAADEHSQIWEINSDKEVKILIDSYQGKRLNGPNDLWIAPDGGIYFTDPYYQRDYWERTSKEIMEEGVYYISPSGRITRVVSNLVKPNGIIGTPDGKTLYIADIEANKTFSFKIGPDGMLSDKKLFAELGSDGMTIDNKGNVYLTGNGVTVFDSSGNKIQHIPIDKGWTSNVTFGGKNQDILFITTLDAIYALQMNVNGVRW